MPNTAILSSSYQRVIDFSPPGTVHEALGKETQHNLIPKLNVNQILYLLLLYTAGKAIH